MTTKPSNPAAFPSPNFMHRESFNGKAHGQYIESGGGMTLLDYFAAAALQGLIAAPAMAEGLGALLQVGKGVEPCKLIAVTAYAYADAMLAAREATYD